VGQDHPGIAAPAGHAVLVHSGQEYSNERRSSRKCRGLAKNEAAHELTVKHEDVPGFIPAMTMPYKIKHLAPYRRRRGSDSGGSDYREPREKNVG
jgi:hypothetical protein